MAAEIRATLEELKSIAQEIYNLNKSLKELRERKKGLEQKVLDYLVSVDKPGVKVDNIIFMNSSKTKRAYKKKDEVVRDAVEVLKRHGVTGDPVKVYEELVEAKRGEASTVPVVKMKAAGLFA